MCPGALHVFVRRGTEIEKQLSEFTILSYAKPSKQLTILCTSPADVLELRGAQIR
jgi:hypothetical protein